MNELIKNTSILVIIMVVAAMALAVTNNLTKDKIKQTKAQEFYNLVHFMFKDADRTVFTPFYKNGIKTGEYYKVYNKLNQEIGIVILEKEQGYQSQIELLIGFDNNKNLKKVMILNQLETPGIGSKISELGFLNQFTSKKEDEIKLTKDSGLIDGISGATISSTAVVKGVRESFDLIK